RLLAHDLDEASDIVESALEEMPAERVYDNLLLPALTLAKGHHQTGELSRKELRYVCQAIYDVAADTVAPRLHVDEAEKAPAPTHLGETPHSPLILGCPARDETEHVALHLLEQLMNHGAGRVEVMRPRTKPADIAARAGHGDLLGVCIIALPP